MRFRSCNASVYAYQLKDGSHQLEFWSYSTPMVIKIDDKVYMNNKRYSNSTSRQVSWFMSDYGISTRNMEYRTEYELRDMCK